MSHDSIRNAFSDVIKINIHSIRTRVLKIFNEGGTVIVDRRVYFEFINEKFDFFFAADDPDNATSLYFSNLCSTASNSASSTGNNESFTLFRLSNIEQPKVGRKA